MSAPTIQGTHPLLAIVPSHTDEEYAVLRDAIATQGQSEPIDVDADGRIVDGRARHRACTDLGVEPITRLWTGEDPALYILGRATAYRTFTTAQRGFIASDLARHVKATKPQKVAGIQRPDARSVAGKALKVNHRYVDIARKIADEVPDIVPFAREGKISIPECEAIRRFDLGDQRKAVKEIAKGAKPRAVIYEITQARALRNAHSFDGLGTYDLIYMDPPWQYDDGAVAPKNDVRSHYATMSIEEIGNLPISTIASKNCALAMWCTGPKLPEQLELLTKWGFTYRCPIVWEKTTAGGEPVMGMGSLVRHACEFLVIATRGDVPALGKAPINVIHAQRLQHSEKPEAFRKLIEGMFPAMKQRVELFARQSASGWIAWGSELGDLPTREHVIECVRDAVDSVATQMDVDPPYKNLGFFADGVWIDKGGAVNDRYDRGRYGLCTLAQRKSVEDICRCYMLPLTGDDIDNMISQYHQTRVLVIPGLTEDDVSDVARAV